VQFRSRRRKPFPKISVNLIAPGGQTDEKIELLCDGQQVVVAGLHPDTRRPYEWHGGELGNVKLVDLPCINEAEARTLVGDAVELLVTEHGYTIAKPRPKANGNAGDSDGAKDWSWLIDAIIQGGSLHDNTCALAAKVVAGGMRGDKAVSLIRAVMDQSKAPRDQRFSDRLSEIPRLVSSAEEKYSPAEEDAPPAVWNFHDGLAAPTRWSVKSILPETGVALFPASGGRSRRRSRLICPFRSWPIFPSPVAIVSNAVGRSSTSRSKARECFPLAYHSLPRAVASPVNCHLLGAAIVPRFLSPVPAKSSARLPTMRLWQSRPRSICLW
jgi:hypothetical protein